VERVPLEPPLLVPPPLGWYEGGTAEVELELVVFPAELEGVFFARGSDDPIRGVRLRAGSGALFVP